MNYVNKNGFWYKMQLNMEMEELAIPPPSKLISICCCVCCSRPSLWVIISLRWFPYACLSAACIIS